MLDAQKATRGGLALVDQARPPTGNEEAANCPDETEEGEAKGRDEVGENAHSLLPDEDRVGRAESQPTLGGLSGQVGNRNARAGEKAQCIFAGNGADPEKRPALD